MKRLPNRTVGIDQGTAALFSDFDTGGEMWTGGGPRERHVAVDFSSAFAAPPAVHVTLSMLDVERRHNHRIDISAAGVTAMGFQIVFRTWGDTRIARARATWLAIGELPDDEVWDL